jgi:sugar lactone lactonase YvrE
MRRFTRWEEVMSRRSILLLAVPLVLGGVAVTRTRQAGAQAGGSIITHDPGFDRIVPPGAQIEKLVGGFQWPEGPVWDPSGRLLFSDIAANRIVQWTPNGTVTTFRRPSGYSNGLTLDRQGRLIACEHRNRRISRTEKDGTIVTLADRYDGKRLNSPNDVVVHSNGSIYFTDPPYGLLPGFGGPGDQELPFQGVYRLSPEGQLTLLVDDFERPNGIALSPDEKTLYVDDSQIQHVRAFDVAPDGSLTNHRIFADVGGGTDAADGMKVDTEGNLYVSAPGGVQVFSPSGKHLGTLRPPEAVRNVGWGDADYKSLFMTASTSLYRIRLNIPGIRP